MWKYMPFVLVLVAPPVAAQPDDPLELAEGKALYLRHCAACHGRDGTGGGPVSPWLIRKPADLTTIAARNDGVFPDERVWSVIDGRADVAAHGLREMPVWGERFSRPGDPDAGRGEIDALVDYIAILQGPSPQ